MFHYSQNEINSLYLEKGFKVVPFNSLSGRCYVDDYQDYNKIISYSQLKEYNEIYPTAYWGAVMGNGNFGLDIDCKKGAKGYEWLDRYEKTYGNLPETWEVLTPSGGRHKYFLTDKSTPNSRMGAYDCICKGNVLFIPSTKRNGGEYTFLTDPFTTPIAKAPLSLIHLLQQEYNVEERNTPKKNIEHSEIKCDVPYSIRLKMACDHFRKLQGSKQGENASGYFFALAMSLIWGYCLKREDAEDILYNLGQKDDNLDNRGNVYKWTAYEIQHKINSAIKDCYSGEIGDKLNGWTNWVEIPVGQPKTASEPPKTEKGEESQPKIKFMRWAELEKIAFENQPVHLVKELLVAGEVCMVYGSPWAGKSTIVCKLMADLTQGTDFFGFETKECPVVYLNCDQGSPALICNRIKPHIKNSDRINKNLLMPYFDQIPSPLNNKYPIQVVQDAGLIMQNESTGVLIIDTMRTAFISGMDAGGENDSACIMKFLPNLKKIANISKWAIILIHHANKGDGNYSGSSSIAGQVDCFWELSREIDSNISVLKVNNRHGYHHEFAIERDENGNLEKGINLTENDRIFLAKIPKFPKTISLDDLAKYFDKSHKTIKNTLSLLRNKGVKFINNEGSWALE